VHVQPASGPPLTEDALLDRAHLVAGHTIGELAERAAIAVPREMRRAKGLAGQLLERYLGADAGSRAEPDFTALRIELKTLPVHEGKPKESTFVSSIELDALADTDFEDSPVWHKLRRILWMPVEADPSVPLPLRHFGSPILWSPSPSERRVLQDDYERVATLVLAGRIDELDGHLGDALQVRPKAAHGGVRERAPEGLGGYQWTGPRGFYLRPTFTAAILHAAFR
tara:strand:- start:169 stop:846 length:678 start_codon:yes stop_codon:yes gene_type:complete